MRTCGRCRIYFYFVFIFCIFCFLKTENKPCARAAGMHTWLCAGVSCVSYVCIRDCVSYVCIRDCVQVCHTYAYATVCRCVMRACVHAQTFMSACVYAQMFPLSPTMMYITFRKCQLTFADSSCIYDVYSHVFLQKKKYFQKMSADICRQLMYIWHIFSCIYWCIYMTSIPLRKCQHRQQGLNGTNEISTNSRKTPHIGHIQGHVVKTCSKDM